MAALRRRKSKPESWEAVVAGARARLAERQAIFASSIASHPHWHYDLDDGVIEFVGSESTITRRISVVGSASVSEGTWLWSWANDFPASSMVGMDSVRPFGEANEYPFMVDPEWPAIEPGMGDVTAVAAELLSAQGFFRTTGHDVSLYLLIDPAADRAT